jgi:hypothetical protein
MKRNFASFFIVLLKDTAQMMKNDLYSLFVSHLIPKLSHFLRYILSCDLMSLTRNSGNIAGYLIKCNETWYTKWVQRSEQFGLFIWLLWQHTRPQSLLFQFLYDPFLTK